jgi:hypothetical protein
MRKYGSAPNLLSVGPPSANLESSVGVSSIGKWYFLAMGFSFNVKNYVVIVYLILRNRRFQCAMAAPYATFESSLTEFVILKRECITKYNSIPTPDLNLVCWPGESILSPMTVHLMMVLGGAVFQSLLMSQWVHQMVP